MLYPEYGSFALGNNYVNSTLDSTVYIEENNTRVTNMKDMPLVIDLIRNIQNHNVALGNPRPVILLWGLRRKMSKV